MSEDKDREVAGLRKVLERYSYIDDILNEIKGIIIQIDVYKPKIEFFLRKRDVTLKRKNELLQILKQYSDEMKRITYELKKNIKHMSTTDKRLKLQKVVKLMREMIKRIDEIV